MNYKVIFILLLNIVCVCAGCVAVTEPQNGPFGPTQSEPGFTYYEHSHYSTLEQAFDCYNNPRAGYEITDTTWYLTLVYIPETDCVCHLYNHGCGAGISCIPCDQLHNCKACSGDL